MPRPWALRIGAVLVAVAATFSGALFTDRVFYERDILNYWVPHIEVFVRAVAEHSWPLWNPYSGFGVPLLADPSLALAYPPTWLNLFLSPATYYKLLVVTHCAWGGIGVLFLARHRGLGPHGSLVAALAYCLSGPLLSTANLFHHYTGAAWMPWVLLAFHRLLEAPSSGSALRLGAAAAMQVLAGSGEACLMTFLAGLILIPGMNGMGRRWLSAPALKFGALATVLAVGLSAVQSIPAVELLAGGNRPRQGDQSLYWSLHPATLPDVVAFGMIGDLPLSTDVRRDLFEGREPLLRSIYWGPLTLVLALLGLVFPGPGRGPLAAGLAFFLLAAMGRHTPMYPWLLHLPLFPLMRYPIKYLWGASLFVALLAGQGVSSWDRASGRKEGRRALAVGALAGLAALAALATAAILHRRTATLGGWLDTTASAVGDLDSAAGAALVAAFLFAGGCGAIVLRGWRKPAYWGLLTVLVVAADLVRTGWGVNPLGPPALFRVGPALLDTLKAQGSPRVCSVESRVGGPSEVPVRGPANWRPEWIRPLGVIQRLVPPTPARWGLFGSFHEDFTGLASRPFVELSTLANEIRNRVEGAALLRLAGVDYVVTLDPGVFGGALPEVARADSVYASPVRLLAVPDTFPRAFVVDGVVPVAEADAVNALVTARFDPSRQVLLSGPVRASPSRPDFRGSVRLLSRGADRLTFVTDLDGPGVLVVLEAYHPGWHATVDGNPSPVLRANALFRGVPVPAGQHRVEMRFRPASAVGGAGLSLVTLLAAFLLWGRELRGPRGALRPPVVAN